MGATSSEILHILKKKLPLQNDHSWLLLLSWFSKFSGGGPPAPQARKSDLFFNPTLLNACLKLKVRFLTQGLKHRE